MTDSIAAHPSTTEQVLAALAGQEGRSNPYPWYARLRALGPATTAPDGTLVVVGYPECAALLRDHRLAKVPGRFLAAAGYPDWQRRPSLRMMFGSMLMLNPPEHTRLRRAVAAAFTPGRVAALEPAVVALTDDLLDRFAARLDDQPDDRVDDRVVDFVDAVAFPLPVTVIGQLLGIPAADRPAFQQLARDWTAVLDDLDPRTVERADRAATEIEEYLTELARARRSQPADDLVSALTAAGDPLAEQDVVTTAALLLAAGFETTTSLLANGLLALLAHPEQAELVRADAGLAAGCVEELLRYDTPVQVLYGRIAATDLRVAELDVPAGTRVMTLVGAANRDPAVFTDPDRLDVRRTGQPPLSFGGGIHYCLGAPLARLEGRVAFPRLLQRFPSLRPAGTPVPRNGLALHGFTAVPVTLR